MTKSKLKRSGLLIVIVAFLITSFVFYQSSQEQKVTYMLHIPDIEMLESITVEENDVTVTVSNHDSMVNILTALKQIDRSTNDGGIDDYPANANDIIRIEFINGTARDIAFTPIFIYKRNWKYFIEQAYNGVYQISKQEYQALLEVLPHAIE